MIPKMLKKIPKKPLKTFGILFLVAVTVAFTSACSSLRFPGVYRIPILQGNIIDQKKIDQLKLGMDKRQVQYVMGTPLVNDAFHSDRWDYLYQVRRAGKKLRDRRFSVYFENEKLARWEGDYEPNADAPEDTYIEDAKKAN